MKRLAALSLALILALSLCSCGPTPGPSPSPSSEPPAPSVSVPPYSLISSDTYTTGAAKGVGSRVEIRGGGLL